MAKTLLASVRCDGKSGRISGDFNTVNRPDRTKVFVWKVQQGGSENIQIRFNVKDNIKLGADDYYFKDLGNDDVTPPISDRAIFIADPGSTDKSHERGFTVELYAETDDLPITRRQEIVAAPPKKDPESDHH